MHTIFLDDFKLSFIVLCHNKVNPQPAYGPSIKLKKFRNCMFAVTICMPKKILVGYLMLAFYTLWFLEKSITGKYVQLKNLARGSSIKEFCHRSHIQASKGRLLVMLVAWFLFWLPGFSAPGQNKLCKCSQPLEPWSSFRTVTRSTTFSRSTFAKTKICLMQR